MIINVTEKLVMRTNEKSDANKIIASIDKNREHLREWLPWVDGTKFVSDVENVLISWAKQLEAGTDFVFGIYFDEAYIGNIGIHNMKSNDNSGMIGYWLAKEYQGKGIMTDCVRILTDYCFGLLNLNRVYIYCALENHKSRSIPTRLGFVQEGILQDAECLYGKYYDKVVYGVLRRNWKMSETKNLYQNTAWLYDVDNRDNLSADIPFYLEYAKQFGGEVLELGCGTGRVSLALARECIRVTGLDLSKEMLSVLEQKLDKEPSLKDKINLIHGNMADFSIDRKFSLIIAPFRAFQALTKDEDIKKSLSCIKEHLTKNGVFIINVFKPHSVMDESWCYGETVQWERLDESTGNYVVKRHWGDKIDTKNQIIYPHFAYEVTSLNSEKERYEEHLALKYHYENQLQQFIEGAGFIINEKFGWYDKTSIEHTDRELIFVCRRNVQ